MIHLFKPCRKVLLLGAGLVLPLWVQAQSAELPIGPTEARNLAAQNVSSVLEWLPPDHLEQFGFSDKDNFSAISIGMPLYSTSFSDASVISGSEPHMQTNMVLVPLSLNGTVRCFIYLSPDESGRWVTSGLGGHNEATAWNGLLSGKNAEAKDHLTLLHIPQNNADYLWQEVTNTWLDIGVGVGHRNGETLDAAQVFQQAVKIAAEARATVKDDAGS